MPFVSPVSENDAAGAAVDERAVGRVAGARAGLAHDLDLVERRRRVRPREVDLRVARGRDEVRSPGPAAAAPPSAPNVIVQSSFDWPGFAVAAGRIRERASSR